MQQLLSSDIIFKSNWKNGINWGSCRGASETPSFPCTSSLELIPCILISSWPLSPPSSWFPWSYSKLIPMHIINTDLNTYQWFMCELIVMITLHYLHWPAAEAGRCCLLLFIDSVSINSVEKINCSVWRTWNFSILSKVFFIISYTITRQLVLLPVMLLPPCDTFGTRLLHLDFISMLDK